LYLIEKLLRREKVSILDLMDCRVKTIDLIEIAQAEI